MRSSTEDFAKELGFLDTILEGTKGSREQAASVNLDRNAIDVSKIKVPAEIYEEFTGVKPKSALTKEELKKTVEKPKPIKESTNTSESVLLTEETGRDLLASLLEIKEMLSEMCMTGTGSLGSGLLGGKSKDPDGNKELTDRQKVVGRIKARGNKK